MFTHQHWNLRHNDQNLKQLELILDKVCKSTNIYFSSSILLFQIAIHNIMHIFVDKSLLFLHETRHHSALYISAGFPNRFDTIPGTCRHFLTSSHIIWKAHAQKYKPIISGSSLNVSHHTSKPIKKIDNKETQEGSHLKHVSWNSTSVNHFIRTPQISYKKKHNPEKHILFCQRSFLSCQ